MAEAATRKRMPLHLKMLLGFAIGLGGGLLAHMFAQRFRRRGEVVEVKPLAIAAAGRAGR